MRSIAAWPSSTQALLAKIQTSEMEFSLNKLLAVKKQTQETKQEIEMGNQNINDSMLGALTMLLISTRAFPALQRIDLSNNDINDAGLHVLARGIKQASGHSGGGPTAINCIDLSHNKVSDLGVEALAEAVQHGSLDQLQTLLLYDNYIQDAGLMQLASSLCQRAEHMRSFGELEITYECNPITKDGRQSIVHALSGDTSMDTGEGGTEAAGDGMQAPPMPTAHSQDDEEGGALQTKFLLEGRSIRQSRQLSADSTLTDLLGPPHTNLRVGMEEEHQKSDDIDGGYGVKTKIELEWLFVMDPTGAGEKRLKELGRHEWPGTSEHRDPSRRRYVTPLDSWLPRLKAQMNANLRKADRNVDQLIDEECIAARLFTGPMHVTYTTVLKKIRQTDALAQQQFANGRGENYRTTLSALSSAIFKLSILMQTSTVYLSIKSDGMPVSQSGAPELPNPFIAVVDGFLSATRSGEMAYRHASTAKQCGVVFELTVSAADKGADLSEFSQYPKEQEVVFLPMSSIEVDHRRSLGAVLQVSARLATTMVPQTCQQAASTMRLSYTRLLKLLINELRFARVPQAAITDLNDLEEEANKRNADWFNSPDNYKDAIDKSTLAVHDAIKKLEDEQTWEDERKRMFGKVDGRSAKMKLNESVRDDMIRAAEMCVRFNKYDTSIELLKRALSFELVQAQQGGASIDSRRKDFIDAFMNPMDEEIRQQCNLQPGAKLPPLRDGLLRSLVVVKWLLEQGVAEPWPVVLTRLLTSNPTSSNLEAGVDGAGKGRGASKRMPDASEIYLACAKKLIQSMAPSSGGRVNPGQTVMVYQEDIAGSDPTRRWLHGTVMESEAAPVISLWSKDKSVSDLPPGVMLVPGNAMGSLLRFAAGGGHVPLVKMLLDVNVSVFECDHLARTALSEAASAGSVEVCKLLVDAGDDMYRCDLRMTTPFILAVRGRHAELIGSFHPNETDEDSADADASKREFIRAIKDGRSADIEKAASAMGPGSATKPDAKGVTPMMIAARYGQTTAVDALIKLIVSQGGSVDDAINAKSNNGCTAIMMASQKGHTEVIHTLALSQALVEETTKNGMNAISMAARSGHLEAVQKLHELAEEREIEEATIFASLEQDARRRCVLGIAALHGHEELVSYLLTVLSADDVDQKNADEETPLMLACTFGHHKIASLLLKHGADAQAKSKSGDTALMVAVRSEVVDCVQVMLDNKADPAVQNEEGWSALMLACRTGQEQPASLLLRHPSSYDSASLLLRQHRDDRGIKPALLLACEYGFEGVTRALLRHKADPSQTIPMPEVGDVTALGEAVKNGHEGVCTVLLEAGARPTNAALVLAIKGRHMAIAMALIESIRSSAQSPVESNTLVVALENCDERVMAALLEVATRECVKEALATMGVDVAAQRPLAEGSISVSTDSQSTLASRNTQQMIERASQQTTQVALTSPRHRQVAPASGIAPPSLSRFNSLHHSLRELISDLKDMKKVDSWCPKKAIPSGFKAPPRPYPDEVANGETVRYKVGENKVAVTDEKTGKTKIKYEKMITTWTTRVQELSQPGCGSCVLQMGDFNCAWLRVRHSEAGDLTSQHFETILHAVVDAMEERFAQNLAKNIGALWVGIEEIAINKNFGKILLDAGFKYHHFRPEDIEVTASPTADEREGNRALPLDTSTDPTRKGSQTVKAPQPEAFAQKPTGAHSCGEYVYYRWPTPNPPYQPDKVPLYLSAYEGGTAVIVSPDETKVLLCFERNRWQLPGGSIKMGENVLDGIRREVKEEVNVDLDDNETAIYIGGWNTGAKQDRLVNSYYSTYIVKAKNDRFATDNDEVHAAHYFSIQALRDAWSKDYNNDLKTKDLKLDLGDQETPPQDRCSELDEKTNTRRTTVKVDVLMYLHRWKTNQGLPVKFKSSAECTEVKIGLVERPETFIDLV